MIVVWLEPRFPGLATALKCDPFEETAPEEGLVVGEPAQVWHINPIGSTSRCSNCRREWDNGQLYLTSRSQALGLDGEKTTGLCPACFNPCYPAGQDNAR